MAEGVRAPALASDTSRTASDRPLRWLVAILVGLQLAYMLGLNITPVLNGVWSDRLQLGPSAAGLVISTQVAAMALATILTGRVLARLPLRRSAGIATAWTIGCYLATGFATTTPALMLCFGLSGVGIGVQMALLAGLLSRRADADRVYAIAAVATSALVALLTVGYAALAAVLALPLLFLVLAAVPLVQLLAVPFLPVGALAAMPPTGPAARVRRRVPPVLLAMIFMQVGGMAVWAFTERIGHALHIPPATIGAILGSTALAAVAGAACAARAAGAGRRRMAAIAGLCLFGGANLSIALAPTPAIYTAALLAQAFGLTFTLPFLTAIALEEADDGRTAATASGWALLVGAISPYAAGWLVQLGGLHMVAVYCAAALVASVAPLLPPARGRRLSADPS